MSILLGKGDGSFTPTSITTTLVPDTNEGTLALADFNADGKLDLAVEGCEITDPPAPSGLIACTTGINIMLSDSMGHFAPGQSYPWNPQDRQHPFLPVDDFNADGIPDLVVLDAMALTVYQGNGDGTFTALAPSPAGPDIQDLWAVGDFNGDGKLDVVLYDQSRSNYNIFLGDSAGNFPTMLTFFPNSFSSGLRGMPVADFNGDGRLDFSTVEAGFPYLFLQAPDLDLSVAHTGSFSQGQAGATYTITVNDGGSVPTTVRLQPLTLSPMV